jgi:hypothetical protein
MEWYLFPLAFLLLLTALGSYWDTAARIGRIERKLNLLIRHSGIDSLQGMPVSERVKQIASDPARKIEAIKVYREETGASLKEAKDAVEAFINSK